MGELTEVLWQSGDQTLIDLFNNTAGLYTGRNERQLQQENIGVSDVTSEATGIYAENPPKDSVNVHKLIELNCFEITIKATDVFPEKTKRNAFKIMQFYREISNTCLLLNVDL